VVHCDISPEAAKNQAFEKLLTANGIAWQPQAERSHIAGKAAGVEREMVREESVPAVQNNLNWRSMAAGERNSIYVEATPAQIEATLAGLAAQPKMFLSFSPRPATGQSWQQVIAPNSDGRRAAGNIVGEKQQALPNQSAVGVSARQSGMNQAAAESAPAAQSARQQLSPNGPLDQFLDKANLQRDQKADLSDQTALKQQALFVLRIAGVERPTASQERPAGAKSPANGK